MKTFSAHRPPHRYDGRSIYFLTGRIFQNKDLLEGDLRKKIFLALLKNISQRYKIKLYVWIVLDNHYHLLFNLLQGAILKSFINRLHSVVALKLNQQDSTLGRQVWYQ